MLELLKAFDPRLPVPRAALLRPDGERLAERFDPFLVRTTESPGRFDRSRRDHWPPAGTRIRLALGPDRPRAGEGRED